MIRPKEFARFLASARDTVADDLRPKLADQDRAKADAVLMLLNRLIADLSRGDDIARERMESWSSLSRDLGHLGVTSAAAAPAAGYLGNLDALQNRIESLQTAFDGEQGFAKLKAGLESGDAGVRQWFARTADALVDLMVACEPEPMKPIVAPQAGVPDAEPERLERALSVYLKARYPVLPGRCVTAVRLIPGGYVKQVAVFSLVPNSVLPGRLVLRKDMPNSITGTSVVDEYPFIEQAYRAGVLVPEPLLLENDPAPLGGSFIIMREVENAVPSGPYFPEERRGQALTTPQFGREVAQLLAQLHSRTRVAFGSTVRDYGQQVEEMRAAWRKLPKPPYSLATELGLAWLQANPLDDDRPWCTVHCDFGPHNILVRDGHIVALLDWELAHVGDPALDLAQCRLALLPGILEWDEFKREYVAAGGDPAACDERAVAYFGLLVYLKHGLNNATVRDMFNRGVRTDIMAANTVSHYHALVFEYQARALKIAAELERRGA